MGHRNAVFRRSLSHLVAANNASIDANDDLVRAVLNERIAHNREAVARAGPQHDPKVRGLDSLLN